MANSNNNIDTDENMLSVSDVGSMTSDEFRRYLEQLNSYSNNGSSASPDSSMGENGENSIPASDVSTDDNSDPSVRDTGKANIRDADKSVSSAPLSPPLNGRASGNTPRMALQRNISGDNSQLTPDEIAQFRSLRNLAADYFPDSKDPIADLTADIEDQIAQERGIDVNAYRSQLADKNDAKLYRDQQQAAAERNKSVQDTVNGWMRDAEQLKLIDPSFDLRSSLANPEFTQALRGGKSLFEAYSSLKNSSAASQQPKRTPIAQNGREKRTGTGESSVNPAKMNSADFAAYIDRIKNG